MSLEKELQTYQMHLSEWPEHEGKFVLIRGDQVVDFFVAYEDALKSGYEKFGLEPFLVKQVQTIERVQFISRMVDPCVSRA